jgi:hypothetical protein
MVVADGTLESVAIPQSRLNGPVGYAALVVVHAGLAAVWLGGMTYSLTVVQPKVARFFGTDDERHEEFVALIAQDNRWKVVALILALAGSGIALWVMDGYENTAAHLVKAGLLAVAAGIFWYVSWRHWPRRVFALPDERPALRRQLRVLATTMTLLVGAAFAIGVSASVAAR